MPMIPQLLNAGKPQPDPRDPAVLSREHMLDRHCAQLVLMQMVDEYGVPDVYRWLKMHAASLGVDLPAVEK